MCQVMFKAVSDIVENKIDKNPVLVILLSNFKETEKKNSQ